MIRIRRKVWFPLKAENGCPMGGQHQTGNGMGEDPGKCQKCGQPV